MPPKTRANSGSIEPDVLFPSVPKFVPSLQLPTVRSVIGVMRHLTAAKVAHDKAVREELLPEATSLALQALKRIIIQMDNISLQADEVQALSSIYEQEWKVVSESSRIYSVSIIHGGKDITLELTLTPGYPSESPPQYQLLAPWLRGDLRNTLSAHLDGIYCDNIGSSILYLWIERVREFLEELQESTPDVDEDSAVIAARLSPPAVDLELSPCPEITHGECILDRKSVFQGHCAPVVSVQQVHQVIASLKECRKIASATHNMWAYRIRGSAGGSFLQDCDDDGETHAGGRMLHLLEILDAQNWVVVVTRWYGGIQLGPDRFRHINNAARNVLQLSGAISPPDEKKKRKT